MLVIQGLDDGIAPPENGRQLARNHPDRVRLLEIEGVGHRLLHDRRNLVVPEILAFVAQQQRALDTREA
jgi:pimeloyl-ACP methyl ester carboxylesterase